MTAIEHIITKKQFSELVEQLVKELHIPYMEAVLMLCEKRLIDPLDVASLISGPIKDRIEAEAIASKLIQGKNTLPV